APALRGDGFPSGSFPRGLPVCGVRGNDGSAPVAFAVRVGTVAARSAKRFVWPDSVSSRALLPAARLSSAEGEGMRGGNHGGRRRNVVRPVSAGGICPRQ